uniref:Uncharacterized protein n=1 Tax=Rhizophora mucronata TaxID=61149 RepID=A0A2P2QAW1_RHIMU
MMQEHFKVGILNFMSRKACRGQ